MLEWFDWLDWLDWLEQVPSLIDEFLIYYQSQALAGQILIGIILFLGFVALGLVIAGIVWLTIQVVKAIIFGVILLSYLMGIGVALIFMSFINPKKVQPAWQEACDNIEFLANKFYPPKIVIQQASVSTHAVFQSKRLTREVPHRPVPVITVDVSTGGHPRLQDAVEIPTTSRECPMLGNSLYCTNCGMEFTSQMNKLLSGVGKCYCESCGLAFSMEKTSDFMDSAPQ
ncbi:MAG: hypothetical protein ACTSUE_11980 [Promethearchaeota archaeon]